MRPTINLPASGRGSTDDPPARPLPGGATAEPHAPHRRGSRGPGEALYCAPGRPEAAERFLGLRRSTWGWIRTGLVMGIVAIACVVVGILGFLGAANGG
jgi:hypothetical protein